MKTNEQNLLLKTIDLVETGSLKDLVNENYNLEVLTTFKRKLEGFKKIYQNFNLSDATDRVELLIEEFKHIFGKLNPFEEIDLSLGVVLLLNEIVNEIKEIHMGRAKGVNLLLELSSFLYVGLVRGKISKSILSEELLLLINSKNPIIFFLNTYFPNLNKGEEIYISTKEEFEEGLKEKITELKSLIY